MVVKIHVLLSFQIGYVLTYVHQKPLEHTLSQQRCSANSYVLNECNWCKCNANSRYTCSARACHEVDMFGHFNDAIRDINVGMEGRGSWRSVESPCEPGVHYQREDLMCVCDSDGNWPNPVCRDAFRVLHQVNIINATKVTNKHKCTPTKYHLIGCTVCYCPSSGRIDPDLCTRTECVDDDPLLENDREVNEVNEEPESIADVYSVCIVDREYKLGCRTCTCLKNNRLLCGKCSSDTKPETKGSSYCHLKKPGEIFRVNCNFCYCDSENLIYCTVKKCITLSDEMNIKKQLTFRENDLTRVAKPYDDENCSPGTIYRKDCNTCYCIDRDGAKYFGCTLINCLDKEDIHTDCVSGSTYEMDCKICHCIVLNGVKRQLCRINDRCSNQDASEVPRGKNLRSLHGYCEPLHLYQDVCNQCRCLADGKTTVCTSRVCSSDLAPVNVEIVPVLQENVACPKGHSYKVDCNICFCLPNGNEICTLRNCEN